jgi:hypothetical protein
MAAETIAAHGVAKDALRIALMLDSFLDDTTPLLEVDNAPTLSIFYTGYSSKLCAYERAMNMRVSLLRDLIKNLLLRARSIASEENGGDIGTKVLKYLILTRLRLLCGLHPMPDEHRRYAPGALPDSPLHYGDPDALASPIAALAAPATETGATEAENLDPQSPASIRASRRAATIALCAEGARRGLAPAGFAAFFAAPDLDPVALDRLTDILGADGLRCRLAAADFDFDDFEDTAGFAGVPLPSRI